MQASQIWALMPASRILTAELGLPQNEQFVSDFLAIGG
jgi:hypothetical protein